MRCSGVFSGALVVFGSLREMKRPRKRRLGRGPAWSASLALRTVGTFTAICVLGLVERGFAGRTGS